MYATNHKMHQYFLPNFILFLLVIQTFLANCCIEHEREALLEFKAGLDDPSKRLASWSGNECCRWAGVTCSNMTGHVVKLHLQNSYYSLDRYGYPIFWNNHSLRGNISPSLVVISDLIHLDLSNNNFSGNKFPKFISTFRNLNYLNMSATGLSEIIPPQLGNLSKLQHLDLAYNILNGPIPPQLGNLSKLQHLDLRYCGLNGMIPPQLGQLSELQYLHLSDNILNGTIPPQLGNLSKLQHLDLKYCNLNGMIPPQLGNLSKLQYLDLSYMSNAFISNVWWFSQLTSLTYLDMSEVNFQDSREWIQAFNTLPLLQTLNLDANNLTSIPASITMLNFSSLEVLSINGNNFNTRIPDWIGKLPKLTDLELLYCFFIGRIPNQLGNLTSLKKLVLWGEDYLEGPMPPLHNLKNLTKLWMFNVNIGEDISEVVSKLANETLDKFIELRLPNTSLTGNLTRWISKMPNLTLLELSANKLNGTIPTEIGKLNRLTYLLLYKNYFTGEVNEKHFSGLSNLKYLFLGSNSITMTMDKNWVPPFQLENLLLGGSKLGPHFPSWLQNQSQMTDIDLSNMGISGSVPTWFWNLPSLSQIDLSHNNMSGRLPSSLEHLTELITLVLSNNRFEGEFLSLPSSLYLMYVDLSNNLLSGPLPNHIEAPSLSVLALSNNFFNGTIEQLTCGLDRLTILNLAENNLSGNLPLCWPNTLNVVNVAHNKLSGIIPSSMNSSNFLWILQLNNNSLTGELPATLQFCRNLTILDIGENKFHGQIPEWIGECLNNLTVLRLRSNMFYGEIPVQIMHLINLQVLDLASNHISGLIPRNLELLTAMTSSKDNKNDSAYQAFLASDSKFYNVSMLVVTKGLEREYTTTLSLMRSIDLSGNNLTGEIPQTITALLGLINLDLSNNYLDGTIPTLIGEMQSIESLDLSMNELSGMIPQSLTNLNFLTTLNLSYNNLSGKIPSGNQLQTLVDPYIYIGNYYLCGVPLSKSCNTSESPSGYETKENDDLHEVLMYVFVVLGFGFGFWVVCGILIFKRNWRYHFFQVVDNGFDSLYVFVVVYGARMHKSLTKRIWGE